MTDDRDHRDARPFPERVELVPIGRVHSAFRQRHGTPRQPGFPTDGESTAGDGAIELFAERVHPDALRDLERFDHLWVISFFHLNGPGDRPMVRPPRGGPKRGVLATRAPHRPNPIGLSVVRLTSVEGLTLRVANLDLLDGTPVLDVKPYVPDFDALPNASRGWLDELPSTRG
jgi:tRNA-Thr(GGU) m(6)t(6)A37 methyltransferase TsaA